MAMTVVDDDADYYYYKDINDCEFKEENAEIIFMDGVSLRKTPKKPPRAPPEVRERNQREYIDRSISFPLPPVEHNEKKSAKNGHELVN